MFQNPSYVSKVAFIIGEPYCNRLGYFFAISINTRVKSAIQQQQCKSFAHSAMWSSFGRAFNSCTYSSCQALTQTNQVYLTCLSLFVLKVDSVMGHYILLNLKHLTEVPVSTCLKFCMLSPLSGKQFRMLSPLGLYRTFLYAPCPAYLAIREAKTTVLDRMILLQNSGEEKPQLERMKESLFSISCYLLPSNFRWF